MTEDIKRQAVSIAKGCAYDDFDGERNFFGYISLMHNPQLEYTLLLPLRKNGMEFLNSRWSA